MTDYIKHLNTLSQVELESAIDSKIADSYHDIIHHDAASAAIAETNATGWACDDYGIVDIQLGNDECTVDLTFHAAGDQDPDRGYCGTSISGEAVAVIDHDGDVTYRNISGSVDHR